MERQWIATSGDSAGWDEAIAGRKNWQINADFNLIVGDTTGFLALQAALIAGTAVPSVKMRSTVQQATTGPGQF